METIAWSALADPNRRAILHLLLAGPRPVGELSEACGLSQPSTSKHLRVLREAGLVRVVPDAQRRLYALVPTPMAELDAWLAPYRRLWNSSLDALDRRLDAGDAERHDDGPARRRKPDERKEPEKS
ncbi:arsR family transcriptional regulator [Planomonospora sphaerica]|uniref:ArsR family transcriptional regulator n=1 Tax=Planomonospora sphaerica TaxID=161355 RepID=A0A171DQG5_9ACTN|nr:metalloregulator ArsR/SmtB family transcription factor [Planomonospora sphaerica]GAT71306.1 arsR family transcriptional regulator [Planomonospora sphaerica]